MNSPAAEVTVIVPTFNRSALVVRALESIRAQISRPAAVIVVDDNSTDDTVERVLRWSSNYGFDINMEIMSANGGPAAARNRGIEIAKTEYVSFLDSDDEYYPEALALLVPPLRAWPGCVLSFADAAVISSKGAEINAFVRPHIDLQRDCEVVDGSLPTTYRLLDSKTWLLEASKIPTSATCFRRDVALSVGCMPTDLRMGEDWIFWLRLCQRGDIVFQLSDVTKHYRHEHNLTGPGSAAAIAQAKLLGFRALLSGHAGVGLNSLQKTRVDSLLSRQYVSWRYHLSRLGLRRYLYELRSHVGRFGGLVATHLLADPRSVLRAMYYSFLELHKGQSKR